METSVSAQKIILTVSEKDRYNFRHSCPTDNIQKPIKVNAARVGFCLSTQCILRLCLVQDSNEAEHRERVALQRLLRHTAGPGMAAETEPMCFLGKINLAATLEDEGEAKLAEAINADRDCDGWYPYMPGLSPIEHYQDRQMRDYERKMEDERIAREVSYRRQDRMFVIAALILAAGQILAAVIVSYRESYADQLLRRLFGP